jgi:hypothetical protein
MRICVFLCVLLAMVGVCVAQDTNFAVGPQYLMTSGSPLFARPIATPTLSFENPAPEMRTSDVVAEPVATANDENLSYVLEVQRQTALFSIYYGFPRVNVVEISFREPSETRRPLPASIVDSGVVEFTDVQALRLRGYGITLPEAAAHWKSHKASAPHHYTNEDIERLRNRG